MKARVTKNQVWRDMEIPNYMPIGFYQVSDMGNVKSLKRRVKRRQESVVLLKERILKYSTSSSGYREVSLHINGKGKTFRVSRLVAIAFIPNPENKPEVNHKNGIKHHDYVSNLEWATRSENVKHAYDNGLKSQRGEKNANAKLNEMQVRIIRKMKGYMRYKEIGDYFEVSLTTVSDIINNKGWIKEKGNQFIKQ